MCPSISINRSFTARKVRHERGDHKPSTGAKKVKNRYILCSVFLEATRSLSEKVRLHFFILNFYCSFANPWSPQFKSLKNPTWVDQYTRRVKEAIQIRLHSNNINRDNGIEIPEAWMPTIRKHNSRSTTKRTREGTSSANRNNKDRNTPITANQRA